MAALLKKLPPHLPNLLIALALGSLACLSLAHHLLHFWEQPASRMVGIFAAGTLVLTAASWGLLRVLGPQVRMLSRGRLLLLLAFSILAGSFLSWRLWHLPADYQSLTVTPSLAQGQTLTLVEIKAAHSLVPLEQTARAQGWQVDGKSVIADEHSQPLTLTFRRTVAQPVTVLLLRSEHSGSVRIDFEHQTISADMYSAEIGNTTLEFSTRYRGLPNEIFLPFLFLVDALAFGALTLALLLVQEAGERSAADQPSAERLPSHRMELGILLGLGLLLHGLNFLSTPLILDADSPAYLQGAVHWLQYGNLDGISVFRGPLTTFLFTPILWAFGRNPWGMKVLLKLVALACIPISYRLGWQLSKRKSLAFVSGLIGVLTPDLYVYSSFIMSDLFNLFMVLLFCTLLLAAFERPTRRNQMAVLLTGSLATLLRSENLILFGLAIVYLALPSLLVWLKAAWMKAPNGLQGVRLLLGLGLMSLITALPLFWWMGHVHNIYGIYSLGNHPGIVMYDSWVYYGDASKLSFSDPNSPAVQKIQDALKAHPAAVSDKTGAATSLELIPSLTQAGYSDPQIYQLLEEAALDSIQKDWAVTLKLTFFKLTVSLRPEITHTVTYSLPGEPAWTNPIKAQFFDAENVDLPRLIGVQRAINATVKARYPALSPWVLFCLAALTLSLLRRPALVWTAAVLIVSTRIFLPALMALSNWRYTVSAWIPLQIVALCWLALMGQGILELAGKKTRYQGENA